MKDSASLRVWKYGFAPAIAGAAPATYFVVANLMSGASLENVASAFVVCVIRVFFLAMVLAVPAAAFMQWLAANPLWYWVSAFLMGITMGFVLADPLMEWHPTEAQLDAGFQTHTVFIYAALFALGAFTYGIRVQRVVAPAEPEHAV